MQQRLGIIGSIEMGGRLRLLQDMQEQVVDTPHGCVKAMIGKIEDTSVVQISRGSEGLAAHAINHRANIAALVKMGVTDIVSTGMVGTLNTSIPIGELLLLDQFLDFTKHNQWTFYKDTLFRDFDFTDPFCPRIRTALLNIANEQAINLIPQGCYVGVDGPRFETAAEVRMFAQLGGDVIGMTIVPECIMAHEAGLCYATIAGVVNLAAGLSSKLVAAKDFFAPGALHMRKMTEMMVVLARAMGTETALAQKDCKCSEANIVSEKYQYDLF
jgi:5'-methylthioadenosine phosphorylase